MAGIKERVYLNDSKSQVRQKLDLQGREKDEGFCTFEVGLPLIPILFPRMD